MMQRQRWALFVVTCFLRGFFTNGESILRVVGGRDAVESAYPYQASLRVRGYHRCGGSLLSSNWILTAAHCLAMYEAREIIVVLGTNSLTSGGTAYMGQETKIYPAYRREGLRNDIGLMKIAGHVRFTGAIKPIRLPSAQIDERNCVATFTGWGNSAINAVNHRVLRVIKLTVIETSLCHTIFDTVGQGHLCTFTVAGEGLCYGDSGGPLVADGVQIGIASWVSPCARGFPDVYTRVYAYNDWINSIVV